MPEDPAPERSAPAAADDAFAADMYRLLSEHAPDLVFSPASVASVLRMALCGARGPTAAELAAALHLDGALPPGGWAGAAAAGLRALAALVTDVTAGGAVTFRAPAAVWVQAGLPLSPGFTARLGAAVAGADFAAAPQAAREQINQAVTAADRREDHRAAAARRHQRCDPAGSDQRDLPQGGLGPDLPRAGHRGRAVLPGRAALTVAMMHGTAARQYVRGEGYQAVVLPYRDSPLAMAIVLPDGPLASLRPALAASGLRGLLAGTARHQVTLAMPKFRQETALDLIPVLRQLGVQAAFTAAADFTGITDAARLLVDAVAHKAFIDVDEQGTEAAAATAVSFRPLAAFRGPPPVTMTVDRPFLYAIVHVPTGLPLFLGQVSHPAQG